MNRQIIESQSRTISTPSTTANSTKPADAPWWQLYSILIITLGTGIVIAINDPALLHNPIVLLAGIVAFFGFVLVWCNKHTREIEAEDWQPLGQTQVLDEPQSTITQKDDRSGRTHP